MVYVKEAQIALSDLGTRLRRARIARNESMEVFADRIGVSVPTLRDMEMGRSTVQIGTWITAIWALGKLQSLAGVLAHEESLLDQMRARTESRLRAYRRSQPKP